MKELEEIWVIKWSTTVQTFGQPSSTPEEVSSLEVNYRARIMICTLDASCRRWCGGNVEGTNISASPAHSSISPCERADKRVVVKKKKIIYKIIGLVIEL